MKTTRFTITPLVILLTTALTGCGAFDTLDEVVPDNTKEYRQAETMPPLDVPPDLSTNRINDDIIGDKNSAATYSEFEEASTNPLASKYNITPDVKPALSGDGDKRHIVVPGERSVTWQRIHAFWAERAYEVTREDARIGLMDTNGGTDGYPFRVRMDRGDFSKQAKVFVAGRGETANPTKDEAMLRQLADFLGVLHQQDQAELKAQLPSQLRQSAVKTMVINEADGQQALLVDQDYADVWLRVGRVLDSKGFAVEDRDRSQGYYFVRYIDPFNTANKEEEGFLDKLKFWEDDVDVAPEEFYFIKLISDAAQTRIFVLDADEVRTSSPTAKRLLGLIDEQLSQ
jgi:outer membrane protein assembly factor BamC